MFDRNNAEAKFRDLSASAIESLPPIQSFSLMLDFYETVRAEGALPESEDGDMLLFQWGTYDWGQGRQFNLNLTRQVIYPAGEDADICQLGLTYYYRPDDELEALGEGNFWCCNLSEVQEARAKVLTSAALTLCRERTAILVGLEWEQA